MRTRRREKILLFGADEFNGGKVQSLPVAPRQMSKSALSMRRSAKTGCKVHSKREIRRRNGGKGREKNRFVSQQRVRTSNKSMKRWWDERRNEEWRKRNGAMDWMGRENVADELEMSATGENEMKPFLCFRVDWQCRCHSAYAIWRHNLHFFRDTFPFSTIMAALEVGVPSLTPALTW